VSVLHAEEACLALMHSSSVGHLLLGCVFGDAKYGVACGYDDPARHELGLQIGGGFTWIGGAVSNHSESDFWLNFVGATGLVSITGANSEGSQRFFLSEPNHMLKNTVSIRDCRISTALAQDNQPEATFPHRIMVDHLAPGPLTLTGCTFHGRAIPIVHLVVEQPTVHHVTGNIWSMAGSDLEDCIVKEVSPEMIYPTHPADNTPGGQLVIEEGNVFLNSNVQLNSLGTANQCRGVMTFFDTEPPIRRVWFTSKERNLLRKNEAFKPTNPSLYYVALSVEVDESNPPPDESRHATINNLTEDGFNIRIGKPPGFDKPGFDKKVTVHWMIVR